MLSNISWTLKYRSINGLRNWVSIPGLVIPKTKKKILDASLLNKHYKVWIKDKWNNPGKDVAPPATPYCCSYWKGSLLVALNYGQSTHLLTYLLIYMCIVNWNLRVISCLEVRESYSMYVHIYIFCIVS